MKRLLQNISEKISYQSGVMFFALCQSLFSAFLGIKFNLQKDFDFFSPILLVFYSIAIICPLLFRISLLDIFSQFHYREKFALFLTHLLFFISPMFIGVRSFTVSAIVMIFPLLLVLLTPQAFARLYLWNSIIVFAVLLSNPKMPIIYPACFILLVSITMMFEYFFFKADRYEERRKVKFMEFLGLILILIILPVGIGFILSTLIPHLNTLKIDEIFPGYQIYHYSNSGKESIGKMMLEALVLVVLITATIALLSWLQRKTPKVKIITHKGTPSHLSRIEETIKETIKKKIFSVGEDLRSKIIFLYNLFIEEIGEIGFRRKHSATPAEYAREFADRVSATSERIFAVTDIFEKARYGKEFISQSDLDVFEKNLSPLKNITKEQINSNPTPLNHQDD